MIPLLVAFLIPGFTLQGPPCPNVLTWTNPLNPYYDIPYYEATTVSLPVTLPKGDTLTITSSQPDTLDAEADHNSTNGVVLIPLIQSYNNTHCPPYAETVTVSDALNLIKMTMIVDINSEGR